MNPPPNGFAAFVRTAHADGRLVVQPRMGFSDPAKMRDGLHATRQARATTAGTITLDSYTRVGDYPAVRGALDDGIDLNGYPLVSHGRDTTRAVLAGIASAGFPVQVRHGSPLPADIFAAIAEIGLDASEGGPVSYCLPYSRVPLPDAVRSWAGSCELFAAGPGEPHLESFGGCMLGQLCPPSLLIALTVLEGLFFGQHGLRSTSLSFCQQANPEQDAEALCALRSIASSRLSALDWHVVLYTYMGVHPRTPEGSLLLLTDAARLAVRGGAARLIVKTPAEAHRIPTITENVRALEHAAAVAASTAPATSPIGDTGIEAEARGLVEAVLDLDDDLDVALPRAFAIGLLDVPYCLHSDNAGASRSFVDESGWLRWSEVGAMPIRHAVDGVSRRAVTSSTLISSLHHVARCYDRAALVAPRTERDLAT